MSIERSVPAFFLQAVEHTFSTVFFSQFSTVVRNQPQGWQCILFLRSPASTGHIAFDVVHLKGFVFLNDWKESEKATCYDASESPHILYMLLVVIYIRIPHIYNTIISCR